MIPFKNLTDKNQTSFLILVNKILNEIFILINQNLENFSLQPKFAQKPVDFIPIHLPSDGSKQFY